MKQKKLFSKENLKRLGINCAWFFGSAALVFAALTLCAYCNIGSPMSIADASCLVSFTFITIILGGKKEIPGFLNIWLSLMFGLTIIFLGLSCGITPWILVAAAFACRIIVKKLRKFVDYEFGASLFASIVTGYLIMAGGYFLFSAEDDSNQKAKQMQAVDKTDLVAYPKTVVRDVRRSFPRDIVSTDAHGMTDISIWQGSNVDLQVGDTVQLGLDEDNVIITVLSNSRTDKK